ncbi:hypothetical protein ACWIUD_00630 [Helicobacter sp. 23-1044]
MGFLSPSRAEILHFLPLPCGGGQRGWVDFKLDSAICRNLSKKFIKFRLF